MKAGYTAKAQRSLFVGESAYYAGKIGAEVVTVPPEAET